MNKYTYTYVLNVQYVYEIKYFMNTTVASTGLQWSLFGVRVQRHNNKFKKIYLV